MKKIFYGVYSLFLTLIIITLFLSFNVRKNFQTFSSSNVIKHIKELSSDEYQGRLVGTEGNILAAEYIENYFSKLRLLPMFKDYKDPFEIYAPVKQEGEPYFKIFDNKGNKISEFIYGQDFKETFLNFNTNKITISSKDTWIEYPNSIQINAKDKIIRLVVMENNFDFRSSFMYDSETDCSLFISKDTYNKLLDYNKKGYELKLYIPYAAKKVDTYNVVSYIKGKDSTLPPLILSSHFDHMGEDLLGNIYSGALDNASGTAFVLELARYIKSLPTPNRDIIFISFNGEELGLLGSKHFVENNYNNIKTAIAINFDMIGGNNTLPITFMTNESTVKSRSNFSVIESLETNANNSLFQYSILFADSSDHASFTEKGISSVTLCDYDTSRLHTLKDKAELINETSINRAFSIVNKTILNNAYDNWQFIIYKDNTFYGSQVLLFIFILIPISLSLRKKLF